MPRRHRLGRAARAANLGAAGASAPFVAKKLGLEPGDQVLRLEYIGIVREPMAICTNYVAFPEAEALTDVPFDRDFYTLLDDAGIEMGGSEWVLSATNADPAVARHVGVSPGTALMLGEEIIWDHEGRIFDFAVCYIRTDRFVFSSASWTIGSRDGAPPIASTDGAIQRDRAR